MLVVRLNEPPPSPSVEDRDKGGSGLEGLLDRESPLAPKPEFVTGKPEILPRSTVILLFCSEVTVEEPPGVPGKGRFLFCDGGLGA